MLLIVLVHTKLIPSIIPKEQLGTKPHPPIKNNEYHYNVRKFDVKTAKRINFTDFKETIVSELGMTHLLFTKHSCIHFVILEAERLRGCH
jgi:hypothetical protein